jgi:two-component system, NtrC family, sensor histidine kinase PilS
MEAAAVLSEHEKPSHRQLNWYLLFRVIFITLFLGGTIVYQFSGAASSSLAPLPFLYLLIGVSYLHALISFLFLPLVKKVDFFSQAQIAWDLLFCFFILFATGGKESLFSFAFIFIIISASVFFAMKEVIIVAAAATILYGSLVDLQFYGKLPHWRGWDDFARLDSGEAFYAVFVHVVAFFLTALLSGVLSDRWRKSERALLAREIDYQELEAFNQVILANINSGLMIVNQQGRIRSFNSGATQITGYALEDIYNKPHWELFPEVQAFQGRGFNQVSRAEAVITDRDGKSRVLGYATKSLLNSNLELMGLLITFQDLTQVKEMELQLKRTDRLAAIGRLSASIAHEIRNPLAAISGSVQLLAEDAGFDEEGIRLMGIVVKEADRLSGLLTNFLAYARPKTPDRQVVNVSRLLDEVVEMSRQDSRFEQIEITCNYPSDMIRNIDRDQIRQAIWDLLINAAEATGANGSIRIDLSPEDGSLSIEDDGPGIAEEIQERVFEPFFTTKRTGTGMGLATVFSIIDAHSGSIEILSGLMGGARFRIVLPIAQSMT